MPRSRLIEYMLNDAIELYQRRRNNASSHIFQFYSSTISTCKVRQKTLNKLEDEGEIFCAPKRDKTHRWISWYSLLRHRHLLEVEDSYVHEAVVRLREILQRNPTSMEVGLEVKLTPAEAEEVLYRTAKLTAWYPLSAAEMEAARTWLGESLVLAARIKHDPNHETINRYADMPGIMEKARFYLEKHQELLPTLTENGMMVAD